jgi:2-oxoglutarate ferredoxin oxidoreductase subunit gamma
MIRGIGGQGVKLAGTIIGQAAMLAGRYAVQSMKYGSAITGGETRSEIIVSTEKIIYPKVTDIDVYVGLTQDDLKNYFEARVYLCDNHVAKKIPEKIKDKIIVAPMIHIAEQLGNSKAANFVLIGILTQLFNLADKESFIKALKMHLSPRFHELNINALEEGINLDLMEYNSEDVIALAKECELFCKD